MAIEVRPIAGALGAEISGVDLAKLTDESVAAIRRAWLEHLVIFFREQPLAPADFLRFAKRFGQPIEYPFVKGARKSVV
jgi:taurine dioxygenase